MNEYDSIHAPAEHDGFYSIFDAPTRRRKSNRLAWRAWNYTVATLFIGTILWFGGSMWAAFHSGRAAQILQQIPDLPRAH